MALATVAAGVAAGVPIGAAAAGDAEEGANTPAEECPEATQAFIEAGVETPPTEYLECPTSAEVQDAVPDLLTLDERREALEASGVERDK